MPSPRHRHPVLLRPPSAAFLFRRNTKSLLIGANLLSILSIRSFTLHTFKDTPKPFKNHIQNKQKTVTKVVVLPNITDKEAKGVLKHFILDGILKSSRLERTLNFNDPDAIWVVDIHRFSCEDIVPVLKSRFQYDQQQSHQQQNATAVIKSPSNPWGIYLINFGDEYNGGIYNCLKSIHQVYNSGTSSNATTLGPKLFLALRSQVVDRDITTNYTTQDELFQNLGKRVDSIESNEHFQYLDGVRVVRYGVRSDLVHAIKSILSSRQQSNINATNIDSIVTMPRPLDAIHFWRPGSPPKKSTFRNVVSKALLELGKDPKHSHRSIESKQFGERKKTGRNRVDIKYPEKLLEYKIIVVAQRDRWEDHYRLMEALTGGAMVMTDPMHPLPYRIEDGKQVIEYHSLAELKRLIIYYLEHEEERLDIARSGHENAMQYHQSHSWMERLVFGEWEQKEHGAHR